MAFSVPNFNITCNIWWGHVLPPGPPDLTGVPCNLAYGRRVNSAQLPTGGTFGTLMTLLLPVGTDIRCQVQSTLTGYAEVPAGTGRFYSVLGVDDIGKGFPNEHRAAILAPSDSFGNWPTPYP